MGPMALCVMTPGTIRMRLWSADNWDSPPTVRVKHGIVVVEQEYQDELQYVSAPLILRAVHGQSHNMVQNCVIYITTSMDVWC